MSARRNLCILLALLCGCAAGLQEGSSNIDELRRRAAAHPDDASALRAAAFAELFGREGKPDQAPALLSRALKLEPNSTRTWFAAAIADDAHGHPERALTAYLQAIRTSLRDRDEVASRLGEVSTRALGSLAGSVADYRTRVTPVLQKVMTDASTPLPTRMGAGAILIELAARAGDADGVSHLSSELGCIDTVRVIGPFGPRDLLSFDDHHGARPGAPFGSQYDLGKGRGVVATREVHARGCALNLGGGPIADGGTTYAQAYFETPQAGAHLIRLQSQSSTELFIDGHSVLLLDRRKQLLPDTQYVALLLSAGRHEVTLKLTSRNPNPAVTLAVALQRPRDQRAIELPFSAAERDGFAVYARAAVAMGRADVLSARQILDGIDAQKPASPLLLALRANVMTLDPLLPANMREDGSRGLLQAALARDPALWAPTTQLAGLTAGSGRTKESIEALRKAVADWPEVPAVGLSLAQLLRKQHFDAEASHVVDALRKRVPDNCDVIAAELDALRERERETQAEHATAELMSCDARSNARYALLVRRHQWPDASRELERLAALDPSPSSYPWIIARLELAKQRGDGATVAQQVALLRAAYPRSENGVVEDVDRLALAGDEKAALAALTAALRKEPASLADLQRLVPVLGGEQILAPYRIDGLKMVQRFEQSGRHYDGPSVLVFDYLATRIFEDGSAIELVHTIQKAQSHEAIEDLAEVRVPEGARVLKLRTIKADGRKLEPDHIGGKDTVSMPTVAPGDYVEFEYIQNRNPSEAFPAGYDGERFYFKSFEVPFDHSQMVVIAPKDFPLEIDPRGAAPEPSQRSDGDLRILDFHVDQSVALRPEPSAVSPREYLPSVRLATHATWESFIESLREGLRDRELYDPEIAALVQQIVGDADPGDLRTRAERLYTWVLANVENNDDVFSQASVMLRARAGNRARVLRYVLGLAGVPATLGLVRSASADNTPSNIADDDTYEHLLVAYQGARGLTWLFTVERFAPFGYLPPLLRGQQALLLAPGAPRVTLPEPEQGQDLRKLDVDLDLQTSGAAKLTVRETLFGAGAVMWRSELESIPAAELNHRFEEEYAGRLLPGARLASLAITGREQRAASIVLAYELEVPNFGRRIGSRWALPPIFGASLGQTYASLAERTTDELIPNPVEVDTSIRIHLPDSATVIGTPEPTELTAALSGLPLHAAKPSFALTSSSQDRVLTLHRKLELPAMRISVPAYAEFAEFCRSADRADAKEVVLELP